MKQKLLKNLEFWLTNLICLLPIVVAVVMYPTLPEKVPTHFNFNFQPDSYSSKLFGTIGIPLFMLAVTDLIWFFISTYPKYDHIRNSKVLQIILWFIPIMSCLIQYIIITAVRIHTFNIVRLIPFFIGIFLIVIGNYLPKSRQNYIIGIRTPWSLYSKENWNKTNRFSGKVSIVGGILMILASFINRFTILLTIISILLIIFVPFVYSYYLFQKEHSNPKK